MNKRDVLEKLAFDPSECTLKERVDFACQGKYLSVLKSDPKSSVRLCVAAFPGYARYLINDSNEFVRNAARRTLDLKIHERSMRFGK